MKRILLVAAIAFALSTGARAQTPAVAAAHSYTEKHQAELLKGFEDFVAIPNVAADQDGLRRNAEYLVKQLTERGVSAQLLTAAGAPPVVYGELRVPGATRTVVFYAHYDGQPVTPSEWENGSPFTPVVKQVNGEPRLYGRGTGDDKAAIFAQLTALSALQAAHVTPAETVRFVWEGEEEAGSRHLEEILAAHRDLSGGDVWLVCDGPVDQTRRQQLVFGARGDTHVQITVFGPDHPLHSGHYGNWAPNPAMMLAQLLAGMKDEHGRVTIPHFYEGIAPLGEREQAALQAAPVNDGLLRKEMKLGQTMGNAKLLALLNEPSLEVTGISSGQVAARTTNSIPSRAIANLDLRLVVGTDGATQQQRVVEYIRSRGYFVTHSEPTAEQLMEHPRVAWVETPAGEEASRTPMDLPIAASVIRAVEAARGRTVLLPTSGGTVPLPAMQRASGSRAIMVPIANHDDNQHAANENLRLQNLWDGVETMASLMALQ